MKNAINLRQIGEELVRKGIPVEWQRAGHPYGDTIRGMLRHTQYRVCLGRDDRFAWLGVWGFREKAPSVLLEMDAHLSGLMRLVQRWAGGTVHGLATWPEGWPANAVIECLGADLRFLSHPGAQNETSVHPLSKELKNWLRDLASTRTPLRIVPAVGPEFEFIAACQGRMRQIRAEQLGQHLISLSSFVTNWPTDKCCIDATARIVLVLNARLRWARLRRLGTAIHAQMVLPTIMLNHQSWRQVCQALDQSIRSCREPLKALRYPEVASTFLRFCEAKACPDTIRGKSSELQPSADAAHANRVCE